ncbi:hypothetical protein Hypma_008154 [Hypsizygus marmoreus]|uniref:Uncharacterized protein n=1 Tax=Hypsizygus marmoreus TaxID=39966 RepID=A0A369JWE3_HYPMA|nr:hypothetical protein Hypma_008154 [Hypsizygus marmoreus]
MPRPNNADHSAHHPEFPYPIPPPTTRSPDTYDISLQNIHILAYKKVANRVKPVATTLSKEFQIVRCIPVDPLLDLPVLPFKWKPFSPGKRYTNKCMLAWDVNPTNFLWPEEVRLVHEIIKLQELGFAWDKLEKGRFSSEYFDLVVIPTIEHVPWVLKNILILPGIFKEVVGIIKDKIASSIYEDSNSSYRSQ